MKILVNYRKLEYRFRIADLIDPSQEYHLWICSFSLALQDLIKTHKLMFVMQNDDKFAYFSFYFYKLGLSFVKESIDIIESCLKSASGDYLKGNKKFYNKYQEFSDKINSSEYQFVKSVLEISRNKVFHYNNFHSFGDAKPLKRILKEMKEENFESSIILSTEDIIDCDIRFAEEIQVRQLYAIVESINNSKDISNNQRKISTIMADVITMLFIILYDFFEKTEGNGKIRVIKSR